MPLSSHQLIVNELREVPVTLNNPEQELRLKSCNEIIFVVRDKETGEIVKQAKNAFMAPLNSRVCYEHTNEVRTPFAKEPIVWLFLMPASVVVWSFCCSLPPWTAKTPWCPDITTEAASAGTETHIRPSQRSAIFRRSAV